MGQIEQDPSLVSASLNIVLGGRSMTMEEAASIMNSILEGHFSPSQLSAFLTALRIKGETAEEIAGFATVMRDKALPLRIDGPLVDTCGTGGDGSGTFNISTAAAFVAAGVGLKVAKHGNRAASGKCGSADVLEGLGVAINLKPEQVERCISEVGIGFLFAPIFHSAMKHAALVRSELGFRTVFNILGPLTNPAAAEYQLLGVATPSLGPIMARSLQLMESKHSLVVHGEDGLDEFTLGGDTHVWELLDDAVTYYTVSYKDYGFPGVPMSNLKGGSPSDNAFILRRVLMGEPGAHRNVVLLNSAAVLLVGGKASDLKQGIDIAAEAIDSGYALQALEGLVELSQELAHSTN